MSRPRLLIVVALIAAVLGWLAWRAMTPHAPAPTSGAAAGDSLAPGFRTVELWFVAGDGETLVSETREVIEQTDLRARVASLVAELDRGPMGGHLAPLPPGTAALHAFLDERGLLTVDLSPEFRAGFRGGAGAELAAVAALVRTLGAGVPEARRVLLVCDGRPLATLGGHVPLDRPFDVSEFR